MKINILDPTLRQRFYTYYQENGTIPDLYFTVYYNSIPFYNGLESHKQIYGTTAEYSFVVPRVFANYPVTLVEIYEIDSSGNIANTPSIELDYSDEYIKDGIDQIIQFELMLTDSGNYVSAVDMFLLAHVTQSIYFSDDIVIRMLKNEPDLNSNQFYLKIINPTSNGRGTFSYQNGLMVHGDTKEHAYLYNYETGEIYLV